MKEYLSNLSPWTLSYIIVAIGSICSIIRIRADIHQIDTPKAVKIRRVLIICTDLLVCIAFIMALHEVWKGLMNYTWTLLFDFCLTFVLLLEIMPLIKINKIIFRSTSEIIATNYALLSEEQFERGLCTEAIDNIKRACDLAPNIPENWLVFSRLEKDIRISRKYIEIAENLIKKNGLESKAMTSLVEYCKGLCQLEEGGSIELALEHFYRSLELNYDKEHAQFVQNIETRGVPLKSERK